MKRAMEQTMEAGAKGIKIQLSGRLGGAEMSRREKQIAGSIPLIDPAGENRLRHHTKPRSPRVTSASKFGSIKARIARRQTDGADAKTGQAPKKPKRTYKR